MNAETLPKVKMPNKDNFIIKFPDKDMSATRPLRIAAWPGFVPAMLFCGSTLAPPPPTATPMDRAAESARLNAGSPGLREGVHEGRENLEGGIL